MANPEEDVEKAQSRHVGPIVGIVLALAMAAVAMVLFGGTEQVEDDVLRETEAPQSAVSTVNIDDVTTDASEGGEVSVERVTN